MVPICKVGKVGAVFPVIRSNPAPPRIAPGLLFPETRFLPGGSERRRHRRGNLATLAGEVKSRRSEK
jgi:hypothetical protein